MKIPRIEQLLCLTFAAAGLAWSQSSYTAAVRGVISDASGAAVAGAKVQLERALLAIEVFPRCALLLSVFEGMTLEDAVILLGADRRLVRKGQMTGLRELTRNLARMQGSTSTTAKGYVVTSEMQHA